LKIAEISPKNGYQTEPYYEYIGQNYTFSDGSLSADSTAEAFSLLSDIPLFSLYCSDIGS